MRGPLATFFTRLGGTDECQVATFERPQLVLRACIYLTFPPSIPAPAVLYHSTTTPSHQVDLKEAILRSLPPDNGLYMPDTLPVLDEAFWEIWHELTFTEIGIAVADAFFGEDVPPQALVDIVESTVSFDAPVVTLEPATIFWNCSMVRRSRSRISARVSWRG